MRDEDMLRVRLSQEALLPSLVADAVERAEDRSDAVTAVDEAAESYDEDVLLETRYFAARLVERVLDRERDLDE
jgi:transcription termination factor NusB